MNEKIIKELLESELNSYERKIHASMIDELVLDATLKPLVSIGFDNEPTNERDAISLRLQAYLKVRIQMALEEIVRLRKRESEFNVAFVRTISEEDRRQLILAFASDLGATRKQLRADSKAFGRWFGADAVKDRFLRRLNAQERKLSFCLGRFGVVSGNALRNAGAIEGKQRLWTWLAAEETVRPLLAYDGDSRVASAAFKCLTRALQEMPPSLRQRSVGESTLQYIYRSAMTARQDVWIQCEALGLLQRLSPGSFRRVLERRLSEPGDGDDLFLRRAAVKLLGDSLPQMAELERLIPIVGGDPSPFVRQALARAVTRCSPKVAAGWVRKLALHDPKPQVRGIALCEGLALLDRPESRLWTSCLDVLCESMGRETDTFVLRVAFRVACDGHRFLQAAGSGFVEVWEEKVLDALERAHTEASAIAVRRWAAQARESLWCAADPVARGLKSILEKWLQSLGSGKTKILDQELLSGYEDDFLGRVLAVLSQDDFGYDCSRTNRRVKLTKGNCFRFRAWRLLHEFRNPSPDKRQAFPHTIGRVYRGNIRVPSAVLSELAATKVPGEPLFISEEQGWRPFLPLVDDVLSGLDRSLRADTVRFYTNEGITELSPPSSLLRRLLVYAHLTAKFSRYAQLRNWQSDEDGHPRRFLEALEKLGFKVEFRSYSDGRGGTLSVDPAVTRFFPAGLPFMDTDLWLQLQNYFVSVYENTLYELSIFAALMTALFFGRHLVSNYTLHKARNSIPLVIGGWGTRGKSGTERLKAALFSALGYGFVSKTTGCEAMFLYAHAYGTTREMFLFRPYDKATIWEQRNVVRLAEKIGSDVFLWECMGLTPTYVKILQRQWMKDDISTITNTYPDHEDLQGPAGINIPEVMCNFIAEDSTLYTSEEQMLPVLARASEELNTGIHAVGWLEAGSLPEDVLQRFPYEEHPHNIALVLRLAAELGIDGDYALKEMAAKVVPDIGVLKAFPPAEVRTRTLEFVNGMSANERHGCLGNWNRLGFEKHDPVSDAGTWICTVVNNRADRIARSRVFADIMVRDISVDRHVLIGNNLVGLRGYIRESWDQYSEKLSLWRQREDGGVEDPANVLEAFARKLRIPFKSEHIEARLRAMLEGQRIPLNVEKLVPLWKDLPSLRAELVEVGLAGYADDIARHVGEMADSLRELEAFAGKLETHRKEKEQLDQELRQLMWKWFNSKIVVVEDYFATGNQIIEKICSVSPPGMFCRIMGLQNIKGTGLDFVYRWQAWEKCYDACRMLRNQDIRDVDRGLKELSSFNEYGVLSEEFMRETIEIVRRSPAAQRERFQAELSVVESNVSRAMGQVNEEVSGSPAGKSHWLEKACGIVEEVLDAGDAVKRRKTANAIYRDLVAERIGSERAALELQALNKRQKGGWLFKKVQSAQQLLTHTKGLIRLKR